MLHETLDMLHTDFEGVSAWCIPPYPEHSVQNWWLGRLNTQADVARQPELAGALASVLKAQGIRRAYAPLVSAMSGLVVSPDLLTERIGLPGGVDLMRNKALPADGTFLAPGEAFVMSAGGCPVAIAIAGEMVIAAHAGRDSLIDRQRIDSEEASREHEGIVYAMAATLAENGKDLREAAIHVLFGIPPLRFAHPLRDETYGHRNERMVADIARRWGKDAVRLNLDGDTACLDLPQLAILQADQAGFAGGFYAHLQLPESGPYPYTRHPDPSMREKRYLVIIRRDR